MKFSSLRALSAYLCLLDAMPAFAGNIFPAGGGNVGIGTTNPSNQLMVVGTGGTLSLGANNWLDPGGTGGSVALDNNSFKALMIVGNNITGNSGKGREVKVYDYLNVQGSLNATGTSTLASLGIGTSPQVPLHVVGNSAATTYDSAGNLSGFVENWSDNALIWKVGNGNGGMRFGSATNLGATGWAERFRVADNGNFGIATTNPQATLDVAGSGRFSQVVTAPSFTLTSDARLKEAVAPLESQLGPVLSLRPVTFYWNAAAEARGVKDRGQQIGFLAQEMAAVFPQVVHTGPDGYLSVNYAALVAPVVAAVQELYQKLTAVENQQADAQKQIAQLSAQLKAKDAQLAGLAARLEKLENASGQK